MNMGEKAKDLWQKLRDRARDLARLPLIALAIFASSMIAWLGIWCCWRIAEYVFHMYLDESWVE